MKDTETAYTKTSKIRKVHGKRKVKQLTDIVKEMAE